MAYSYINRAFWGLSIAGGLYAIFISLLLNPWLQRQAFYAHKFHTAWYHDVNNPESFGFADRQISPFYINTPDNEKLYAWHILPLGLYAEHQQALTAPSPDPASNKLSSLALKLLQNTTSRLVINFHGNAGHVAQGWRTDTYKAISSIGWDTVHVLAIDYRGFGLSSGSPSESGLVADGVAAVTWALEEAGVAPERIVLLGQSLGTAVATAVAEHFAALAAPVEFAGVVLVAGFADVPTLLKTYRIGGVVPVLSPLRPYPWLQRVFADAVVDTWDSAARVERLCARSTRLRLVLIHARNDFDIGWKHSDLLLAAAVRGLAGAKHVRGGFDIAAPRLLFDDDPINVFEAGGNMVWQEIVSYGGHNRVNTFAPVVLAIHKAFER